MSAPKAAKRHPANGLALCDRVCDHAVAAFAIWTLLAHAAVFVGAGLDVLLIAAGAAALCGTVALARGLWRHGLGRAQVGDSRFRAEDVSHTRDAVAPGPLLGTRAKGRTPWPRPALDLQASGLRR